MVVRHPAALHRVAVHDAYKGYDGFTGCAHALCHAHAVRELAGIGEFAPTARADGWPRR